MSASVAHTEIGSACATRTSSAREACVEGVGMPLLQRAENNKTIIATKVVDIHFLGVLQ
jgi:hypothetical protein